MKTIINRITKKELYYILKVSLIVITITTAPYIYAWLSTPQGYNYNGLHTMTTGDIPVYYSYINQIKDGNLLLENNFSIEYQKNKILNKIFFNHNAQIRDLTYLYDTNFKF